MVGEDAVGDEEGVVREMTDGIGWGEKQNIFFRLAVRTFTFLHLFFFFFFFVSSKRQKPKKLKVRT